MKTMPATANLLIIGLAGVAIGWILALRALADLGPLGWLAGLGFLAMVIWGLARSTKL
jgi:hypothetical protein